MHTSRCSIPKPARQNAVMPSSSLLPWQVFTVMEAPGARAPLALQAAGEALLQARCADGLLLQPSVGDTVIAAQVDGTWRVLLVLDRAQAAAPAVLSVPRSPSLRIEAGTLSLFSRELEVNAQRTTARLGWVRLSAQALRMAAQRVAVWADSVHTRARSVSLRADMRVVRVDETDLLHAGQALTEVEGLARIGAGQIQMGAKDNVLIDGKRISLG